MVIVETEVHGPLVNFHWNTRVPTVSPVIVVVFKVELVITHTGPAMRDHVPAPTVVVFAAIIAEPTVTHTVWLTPALAGVGGALTVMVTSLKEGAQGLLEIVHR